MITLYQTKKKKKKKTFTNVSSNDTLGNENFEFFIF
jgi:hypothetical protein